jgi:hypothetical protein
LKKQATVETATFGSEFITARTTIDQIVDLWTTLHYLGIPIWEKSYIFGDNKTINDTSLTPHAKLHKKTKHSIVPSCTRSSHFQVCQAPYNWEHKWWHIVGLESFSNMLEPQSFSVEKMGYISVGHLLPLDFT